MFVLLLVLKVSLYSGSTLLISFGFVSEVSAEGKDKRWSHSLKKALVGYRTRKDARQILPDVLRGPF